MSLEKQILAKNTYLKIVIRNTNYIDIHSVNALPLLFQNEGESKNFRKISGGVEDGGWWGWVKLPELWGVVVGGGGVGEKLPELWGEGS